MYSFQYMVQCLYVHCPTDVLHPVPRIEMYSTSPVIKMLSSETYQAAALPYILQYSSGSCSFSVYFLGEFTES